MILSEPHCYIINSSAIGDTVASLPVLKYAIEKFHKDKSYIVIAPKEFRDLFFFVPDERFGSVFEKVVFDELHSMSKLNIIETKIYQFHQMTPMGAEVSEYNIQRLTPLRLHLTQYASLNLLGRLINLHKNTIPRYPFKNLNDVDVTKFDINYTKAILITAGYRAYNRKWNSEEFKKLTNHIIECGYTPIFIGKSNINFDSNNPYNIDNDLDFSSGINLIDKTTLKELIKIMYLSKAIIGIDNGLLWLAGMTNIPIIAGYNIIDPELRKIYRENSLWIPIGPDIECKYCQSSWNINGHDFSKCYFNSNECVNNLTADKFIQKLTSSINLR